MPSDCGNRDAQSRRRWDDVASHSSGATVRGLSRISDATSRANGGKLYLHTARLGPTGSPCPNIGSTSAPSVRALIQRHRRRKLASLASFLTRVPLSVRNEKVNL